MGPQDVLGHADSSNYVGIMLTEQCNYTCRHCCFSSGMHMPKGYVTDEVLRGLNDFARKMANIAGYERPQINLIGGEPTLNLKEFKRCLDYLVRDNFCTMVTNGWWFWKPKFRFQFFQIVVPYIDDPEDYRGVQISISDDKFHDEERGKDIKELKFFLSELQDYPAWICECGDYYTWLENEDDESCPSCGKQMLMLPETNKEYPWINIRHRNNDMFYPIGRGSDVGSADASRSYCARSQLNFHTDGTLSDICCIGNGQNFGTIWDRPEVLMGVGNDYLEQVKPNCWDCEYKVGEWIEENLAASRAKWEAVDWEKERRKFYAGTLSH